jgi:protein-S-isoprenylcysteine O-methyltransferase Ste14
LYTKAERRKYHFYLGGDMASLTRRAILGFLKAFVILFVLVFLPAWTLRYWQGWTFLAVFDSACEGMSVWLLKNDRALLERRMRGGPKNERSRAQKIIQVLITIAFSAMIVIPVLGWRFGWARVPFAVEIFGDVLVALGSYVIFLVLKVNSFAASTIQIACDQRVVSTGPYAVVRHPMYSGVLILNLGAPLALGSWWGLLTIVPMALVLGWRLLDEEAFLTKNLAGYTEYCAAVKYHLVPLVW